MKVRLGEATERDRTGREVTRLVAAVKQPGRPGLGPHPARRTSHPLGVRGRPPAVGMLAAFAAAIAIANAQTAPLHHRSTLLAARAGLPGPLPGEAGNGCCGHQAQREPGSAGRPAWPPYWPKSGLPASVFGEGAAALRMRVATGLPYGDTGAQRDLPRPGLPPLDRCRPGQDRGNPGRSDPLSQAILTPRPWPADR